jgi:4-amino-4-deoxy-L-arabinose transferase-like glycosyltransferase
MQAESIINGTIHEFVEQNSFTIFESSNQIGPVAYPWGFPLLLTPIYAIKGIHPLALKLPGLLFYAGFLTCFYLLMRKRFTRTEGLILVASFAFNPLLIQFQDQILSDIPFLFFSTLSLWLMMEEGKHRNIDSVLVGVTIFLAFLVRTQGALLLASFLLLRAIRMIQHRTDRDFIRRQVLSALVTCSVFGVLFLVNLLIFPSGEISHLNRYGEFQLETTFRFINGYFQVFSLFFGNSSVWKIIYYIVFVFFLIGAWVRRKEEPLFIIFFVVWMMVLITWPSWQGVRFIFPLLPIFIYFAFQGMKFALTKLPEKQRRLGQGVFDAFWFLIIGIFLLNASTNAYANLQNGRAISGPFDPFSREVYDYIQKETAADSIIIFFKPRVMAMMTDRPAIMSTECDRMLKGDYLVLSRKVGKNQQIPPEEIDSCNLPLDQVLKNNRFIVYQIQK